MEDNVVRFSSDGVSAMINYLNEAYEKGEIEGIVGAVKRKDNVTVLFDSQTLSPLETLGLAACINFGHFNQDY